MSEIFCTWDTDLRLWDILYIWHRSGVLSYSSRRHRLETLSFLACVTQTWDSEIFFMVDTAPELWDFHQVVTQISRSEIFNTEDTDPKTWDIQHICTDLKFEILYARHKTQALRYSIRQSQISRPEIFHTEKTQNKALCIFSMADKGFELFYMRDTDLKLWDILFVWHRS